MHILCNKTCKIRLAEYLVSGGLKMKNLKISFFFLSFFQFCLHSGSDTYKEQALAYLKTLYVNVNDSSEETGALNGSYSGDIDSCCSNPYLQVPYTGIRCDAYTGIRCDAYTGIRCDAYTGIRCDAFVLIRISDCYCNLIKAGPHMN